eukprot:2303731-Pyramimonas_sp.AAC.1
MPVEPHGFGWGKFSLTQRMETVTHPGSWYCRCPYHPREVSACGTGYLYCTKEITIGRGSGLGLTSEQVVRKLKQWCIHGPPAGSDRKSHMKLCRKAGPPHELLDDDALNRARAELWDPVDAALDPVV